MLTASNEQQVQQSRATSSGVAGVAGSATDRAASGGSKRRLSRMLRIEWLGQTAASLCWIASVLTYGINATGDWLQLCAASAWLLANIASIIAIETD